MKVRALLVLILLSIQISLFAQQIITSAGDKSITPNVTLQWTLGQIVTGATSVGNISLIQGFQESTIIVSNIYETDKLDYKIKVYPNPAKSLITIEIIKQGHKALSVILLNNLGSKLCKNEIINQKLIIDIDKFTSGTYILHLFEGNRIINNYKIIKQ